MTTTLITRTCGICQSEFHVKRQQVNCNPCRRRLEENPWVIEAFQWAIGLCDDQERRAKIDQALTAHRAKFSTEASRVQRIDNAIMANDLAMIPIMRNARPPYPVDADGYPIVKRERVGWRCSWCRTANKNQTCLECNRKIRKWV